MFSNDDSYTNLVYQSACDRLKEKLQDERTKYLIGSLMPNYDNIISKFLLNLLSFDVLGCVSIYKQLCGSDVACL